jgi:hypothetical protein
LALISKQTTGWLQFPSIQPAGFNFPANNRLASVSQHTVGWLKFSSKQRLAKISRQTTGWLKMGSRQQAVGTDMYAQQKTG